VAALVSSVVLGACMGGGHTSATSSGVVSPSTSAPTSTSTQARASDTTLARDFSHISATDAARFDEASGRLQGELDAIVVCMREEDSDCVHNERGGFMAAFQAAVRTWNTTGPELRSNPCYRRLLDYGTVLSELRTVSRWLFVGTEPGQPVRQSLSDFWGGAARLQEKHRDLAAQFLAACT
jgi:hypothetical protein